MYTHCTIPAGVCCCVVNSTYRLGAYYEPLKWASHLWQFICSWYRELTVIQYYMGHCSTASDNTITTPLTSVLNSVHKCSKFGDGLNQVWKLWAVNFRKLRIHAHTRSCMIIYSKASITILLQWEAGAHYRYIEEKFKAERVGVAWAEFVTISKKYGYWRHGGALCWGEHCCRCWN